MLNSIALFNPLFTLKPISYFHEMCALVWSEAHARYTKGTQCLYGMCQYILSLLAPQYFEGHVSAYLGRLHVALHDFNELLPLFANVKTEPQYLLYDPRLVWLATRVCCNSCSDFGITNKPYYDFCTIYALCVPQKINILTHTSSAGKHYITRVIIMLSHK